MALNQTLEVQLDQSWPASDWQHLTILLAVSGGADSVALARAMASCQVNGNGRCLVGHFNHRLRDEQSEQDQVFVERLADQLEWPCYVGSWETSERSPDRGDGLEAAARTARYDFLRATAEQHGARYIVTAHTWDDQVETILHNIIRGTGLRGMSGIPRARQLSPAVSVMRPMLCISRAEVVKYLESVGQKYCNDHSNRDLTFTRNRIRHQLLPLLTADYNRSVRRSLHKLGDLAAGAQQLIDELVDDIYDRSVTVADPNHASVEMDSVAGVRLYVVRELFIRLWRELKWPQQAMGFEHWERLGSMATSKAETSDFDLPGGVRADLHGSTLSLSRDPPACNHLSKRSK